MNRIHEAFDRVRASEELISSTRERIFQRRTAFRGGFAAVCAAMLLIFGFFGYEGLKPVSCVSIDVNPSIELSLNRFDLVVKTAAFNSDGERVLRGLKLKGRSCVRALELILGSSAMEPYLGEDSGLTFTLAASGERGYELLSDIENSPVCKRYGGRSCLAQGGDIEAAHSHGMSLGKYCAYLTLSRYDSALEPEDCRDVPMSELHERIAACEHGNAGNGSGTNNGSGSGGGNGSGNGNGSGGHHGGHGGHHSNIYGKPVFRS